MTLIEGFVPVVVDEASGFAEFRVTATRTNLLVSPGQTHVAGRRRRAQRIGSDAETKERAEGLEAKIDRTDETVYELCGLTDEDIEIIEEAVGEN